MAQEDAKRTYLVVVDDSEEARVALRFAARRAGKTSGRIEVLGIVEPQEFVQWGGVQSAIEQEQRLRIEGVVSAAIGEILDESVRAYEQTDQELADGLHEQMQGDG